MYQFPQVCPRRKRRRRRRRRGRRKEEGRGRERRGGGEVEEKKDEEKEEVEEEVVLFRRKKIRPRPLKIALYENNMIRVEKQATRNGRQVLLCLLGHSLRIHRDHQGRIRATWAPTRVLISDVDLKAGSNMAALLHYSKDCACG